MALPEGSIVEFKVMYVVNGQQCMNVLHYRPVGSTLGVTPYDAIAGLLAAQTVDANGTIVGEFKKVFAQNVTINQLTCQLVFPTRYAIQSSTPAEPGTVALDCLTPNIQATITKRGALGNRHNIGSLHIGGVPNDTFEEGLFVTAARNRYIALIESFLDDRLVDGLSDAEYNPAILNKEPIPGSDPVRYQISGSTDVAGWELQDEVRVQRRRTVGLGI